MSERNPVTSADLRSSAALCTNSLRRLDPDLWDKLAYGLEWTRSKTAAHIADSLDFYGGDLAMRSQEHLESGGLHYQEGSVEAAAGQIDFSAASLARVADATPDTVRAFHPTGMADKEAFLAMGCVEILLHGYDALVSTDAEFDPDNDLCQRILGRLFPWAPHDSPGWITLLWATGRGELDGQEFLGESWVWHNDLLSEWEGNIPRMIP